LSSFLRLGRFSWKYWMVIMSSLPSFNVQKAFELYQTGLTVHQVAEVIGAASNNIYYQFRVNGIKLRKRVDLHRRKGLLPWLEDALVNRSRLECWLWPFGHDSGGYPVMSGFGGRATYASLILSGFPKPRPPNHFCLHSCDNRSCVNPDHLRWGSTQNNMDDMNSRNRGNVDSAHAAARKFTDDEVREIRQRLAALPPGRPGGGCLRLDSVRQIARDYGVYHSNISNIKLGKTYSHVVD